MVRNGAVLHGRLAYKLSVGVTPNPRWLVTFDDHPHKDEELYEKAFGELIKSSGEGDSPKVSAKRRVRTSTSPSSSVYSKKTSRSSLTSSDSDKVDVKKGDVPNKDSKRLSLSEVETSPNVSDGIVDVGTQESSEQRTLRRQANVDVENEPTTVQLPIHSSDTKKRRLPPMKQSNKRSRSQDGEEVVKVSLLTGTLYLYRGEHPRAEFIRRI